MAIDFGTTASAAAVRIEGGEPQLFQFGAGAASVPSAVWRSRADSTRGRPARVLVGQHAVERMQGVDPTLGELTPKRLVRHHEVVYPLGGDPVPVTSIVAWVLADVYGKVV